MIIVQQCHEALKVTALTCHKTTTLAKTWNTRDKVTLHERQSPPTCNWTILKRDFEKVYNDPISFGFSNLLGIFYFWLAKVYTVYGLLKARCKYGQLRCQT